MNTYADENYDSSEDFWKLTKGLHGIWYWDKDNKPDFDISEILRDPEFMERLSKNQDIPYYGKSIINALNFSESVDGKNYGVISAGRMNRFVAFQLGFTAYMLSVDIYRNKDNLFLPKAYKAGEYRLLALYRETMNLYNFNNAHTRTLYDNNKQITLWNIDKDNLILNQLMKQTDDPLKIIPDMARYGCNFMFVTACAQMITGSVLSPEQLKNIWDQSTSDGTMEEKGWVKNPNELGAKALNALGYSNLAFDIADTLRENTILLGYRIAVPYPGDSNGSHYTLGDIDKNLIYNPGRTWNPKEHTYRKVGVYVK
jgi:hypothetical protein